MVKRGFGLSEPCAQSEIDIRRDGRRICTRSPEHLQFRGALVILKLEDQLL
jgi:hypothetical protein